MPAQTADVKVDGACLDGAAEGVEDELHPFGVVDLADVSVLQFFFQFSCKGVVQKDARLLQLAKARRSPL